MLGHYTTHGGSILGGKHEGGLLKVAVPTHHRSERQAVPRGVRPLRFDRLPPSVDRDVVGHCGRGDARRLHHALPAEGVCGEHRCDALGVAEAQAAAAVADAEEMLAAGDESVAPAAVPPPEEGVYDEEELGEATGERF